MLDLSKLPAATSPIEKSKVAAKILLGLNALKSVGIETDIHYDFTRLKYLFENTTGYAKINAMFDPSYSDIGRQNAFWLEFKDQTGNTVGFHAGRVRQCYNYSVADGFRSGKLFCDNPPNDWYCEIDCPTAEHMEGLVAWPGSLFIYPEYRGRGLTEKIVPLTFAMLRHLHGPATIISTVEPPVVARISYLRYGLQRYEAMIRMLIWGRTVDLFFSWKTADELAVELFNIDRARGVGKAHLPH
jgi:hypothetical protein